MNQKYSRLSIEERKKIQILLYKEYKISKIAKILGRSTSTISRETGKCLEGKGYDATTAQKITRFRTSRQTPKILQTDKLEQYIIDHLRLFWSPNQISRRLKDEFPYDEAMHVAKETIYTYIYVLARGGLKNELISCLRQHRKKRMPRTRGKSRAGTIPNMISISERPAETESRIIPGHWEGDLIMGAGNRTAIATLVERTTRYTMILPLGNKKDAQSVRRAMSRAVKQLPRDLKKSLTYDRGKEMAQHERFSKETKVDVYFADPYSPWQRGTNENTNGLIRQYFPKGTDFSTVSRYEIKKTQDQLNGRPRAVLDYATPYEVFSKLLSNFLR